MTGLLRLIPDRLISQRSEPTGSLIVRWLAGESDRTGIPARALAMGETNATIEMAFDAELSEEGALELACGSPSLLARIPARVRHQHVGSETGRREATIEFIRRVGPDLLQKLAVAGLIERRAYPRSPISIACEARPAEGPERPVSVRVLDYSASGVRAITPLPLEVGTQLFVCPGGACPLGVGAITLRVVRRQSQNDEHLLGCVFENKTGYFRFKGLVDDESAPPTFDRGRDWSRFMGRG
ncbi:MAG TPA: PilZ domain-containing protein [Pirellulaceae bacterium]|jgi:hypothetical protein|nr:PilZ domain-containing protein [Pirellulaceae bacterium]